MEDRRGYVYILRAQKPFDEVYKIGRTVDPERRLKDFGVKLPYRVEPVMVMQYADCHAGERDLHERFKGKRLDGEWFRLTAEDLADVRACHLAWQARNLIVALREILSPDEDWRQDLDTLLDNSGRLQKCARVFGNAVRRLERRWSAFCKTAAASRAASD